MPVTGMAVSACKANQGALSLWQSDESAPTPAARGRSDDAGIQANRGLAAVEE